MCLFWHSSSPQAPPSHMHTPHSSTTSVGGSALRSRNAFMHFLKEYHQKCNLGDVPISSRHRHIVVEAAELWKRLTLREQFYYIEAAQRASYAYRSRDHRMNRVMRLIRKALLSSEDNVNLSYLSSAVKQMRLWKRRTLNGICGM